MNIFNDPIGFWVFGRPWVRKLEFGKVREYDSEPAVRKLYLRKPPFAKALLRNARVRKPGLP